MNIMHKKCEHLKMNLLTKCLHDDDEVHILNNIVVQKRQKQGPCCHMQMQLYLFNLFNDEMPPFCTLLPQAAGEPLLINLIENAHLMIITASLNSQNTVFTA